MVNVFGYVYSMPVIDVLQWSRVRVLMRTHVILAESIMCFRVVLRYKINSFEHELACEFLHEYICFYFMRIE